jgi:hypothetical protein
MRVELPETREAALKVASRWRDSGAGWEPGSPEQAHCNRMAEGFEQYAELRWPGTEPLEEDDEEYVEPPEDQYLDSYWEERLTTLYEDR